MCMSFSTATIQSAAGNSTVEYLQQAGVTVTGDRSGFTVQFEDAAEALAGVAKAKDLAFRSYLKAGGNPRNKRSFASQFAAVTKAIKVTS